MYTINQDDIVGNRQPRKNADSIEIRRNDIEQFMRHSHAIVAAVQSRLDEQLGIRSGTLSSLNTLEETSDTSVRLLRSQPTPELQDSSITLGGHTDIGTMTLLFNVIGGLQVLPAGNENVLGNWRYIRPRPGCAIINVGDTTVEWTGGLLRSSLHRVIRAPGEQGTVPRQSVAYLVRPCHSASMSRLRGGIIPRLKEGESDETRPVSDWAVWRSKQIISGELKPQTRGGNPIVQG
jgi:isopenicillin N synthase-like dioxygenase